MARKVLYFRCLNLQHLKSFFKSFFAALLALIVFFGLLFFLFVGIASLVVSSEKETLEKKSVLVIDLAKSYNERTMDDPFAEISGEDQAPDLTTTLKLIEKAETDSLIAGIYLQSRDNPNGFATTGELREALQSFRKKGKFVIAYGDYISQKAYAVSHVADKIYCHPQGMLEWKGLSVEYIFFKNLLDRLEIRPQVFYAGKFKSATEPFRATAMSDANREQTSVWLNDMYDDLIASVSRARKIDADSLRSYAAAYAFDLPEKAVKARLIDGVKYDDEVKDELRRRMGLSKEDKINFISLSKYKDAVDLTDTFVKDKIAVVYAEGEIVYGKGSPEEIGSDEYLSLLKKIRNDKSVRALVLRINSPGGSSLASEIIWREVALMRKKGMPVVVSMGDVAASGGYYIASNASKIFVQPNTITGSIGVFGIIPDISSFMKNKLGVTFDRVNTASMADAPSLTRPMSEQEKAIVQKEIDRIYLDFKSKVASGRKKTMDNVDSIAQGRVWTGKRALQIGLADAVGGLDDAVKEAAKLAKLKEYRTRTYPEKKSVFEYLFNKYPEDLLSSSMEAQLGKEEYALFKRIKSMKENSGEVKAQLPYEFTIR